MEFHSDVMRLNRKNGVGYLTFFKLERFPFLKHAFSTKLGGVSQNEYSSMNLSFGRGDSDKNVIENYHRFCDAVGVSFDGLVASAQDHHTNIRVVTEQERGIGIYKKRDMGSVDGLLTNTPGITLVTYYADCTPVFFLDPQKKVVGLVHAGWRGTVGRIAEKMVEKMTKVYGSNSSDVIAVIGPAIGPCCYEVDEPVYREFKRLTDLDSNLFAFARDGVKYTVNLWEANRQILLHAGVKQIVVTDICTKCHSDLLFSHRATKGKRGGMTAMISLIDDKEARR